jgi:trk system potassium uptake protein TrkH
MGVTPQLNDTGRLLIIFLMFVGRIGPLTLALAIGENRAQAAYKYPQGDVAVG